MIELNIKINGNTTQDLSDAILEVNRLILDDYVCGRDSNEFGNYEFERMGEDAVVKTTKIYKSATGFDEYEISETETPHNEYGEPFHSISDYMFYLEQLEQSVDLAITDEIDGKIHNQNNRTVYKQMLGETHNYELIWVD
jgi:hypothetical protein